MHLGNLHMRNQSQKDGQGVAWMNKKFYSLFMRIVASLCLIVILSTGCAKQDAAIASVQSASVQSESVQSESALSESVQPATTQPASVQPESVQSASDQSASVQPGSISSDSGENPSLATSTNGAIGHITPDVHYDFLEISDLHDTVVNGIGEPVLSVLATNLKSRDAANPGKTLILSGGDNVDGTQPAFKDEKNAPYIHALDAMGVDATALGNREFQVYGITLLKRFTFKDIKFPILCGNLSDSKTKKLVFEAYAIFTLEGLRVAVVGSSSHKIRDRYLLNKKAGLIYTDHVEAINKYARKIRDGNKADVVFALIHEGGYTNGVGGGVGPLFDVAEQLKGVDAVFGGDTHSVVKAIVNGMPVVVPGFHANGYMNVQMILGSNGERIFTTEYVNLETTSPEGFAGKNPIRDAAVDEIVKAAVQ